MNSRGKKSTEAELLCKKWLESLGWTVHKAAKTGLKRITRPDGAPVLRRDGKPMVVNESHDIFGCVDLLAIRPDGAWAVQVTTQAGRSERRRKVERVPWPDAWRVSLISHEATEDPANRARRKHSWRVEDFGSYLVGAPRPRTWQVPVAVEFRPGEVEDQARARRDVDEWGGAAPANRPPVRRPRKQPCGHPLSAIGGAPDGRRWCGACERERRAMPLFRAPS